MQEPTVGRLLNFDDIAAERNLCGYQDFLQFIMHAIHKTTRARNIIFQRSYEVARKESKKECQCDCKCLANKAKEPENKAIREYPIQCHCF